VPTEVSQRATLVNNGYRMRTINKSAKDF